MVEGTTDRVSYTCTGGKGPYAIPSDMTVSLTARGNATNLKVILVDPDDVENTLTFSTEYTVTGRNVYTVSNYSSSYTLIIARSMPFTQERDLRNQSTLNMEHLETAYDAACMERRELLEQIGRQLVFPISDPDGLNYELPVVSNRASRYLACDASGNIIASSGTIGSVPVSTFMEDLLDDTTGAAALTTLGVTATPEEMNRVADGVTATAAEVNEAADRSARTKLLSEENYTILDDDGYAVFLVVTGAGITGTATTDTENKLIDSTATFVTDGVVAGDYIHNTTDDTWGVVDSVDSETELTLTTDAFPDGDEDWTWAPVTVVLPTAADNTGREIFVKKLDSDDGVVHIAFEAGEDEVDVAELTSQQGRLRMISNGTNWYLVDYWDKTDLTLGTGSADRNIQFATDANLLWDESRDEFSFDKPFNYPAGPVYNGGFNDPQETDIYEAIDEFFPAVDYARPVFGGCMEGGVTAYMAIHFTHAVRTATTEITLYGWGTSRQSDGQGVGADLVQIPCVYGDTGDTGYERMRIVIW